MKFSDRKRQFDWKKHRAILIVVIVAFMGLSLGTALAASGGDSGSKGWQNTDWFRVMNFVVLAGVLVFILRKPVSQALSSRIKGIKEQLESLEVQKTEAEKQLAQYNEKLSQQESEAEKIVDDYIKQGNEAKAKIQVQAKRNIEHECAKAKQKLQQEVVESSLQKAEESLKKEITAQDQDKLVDEYIDKVVV